jgi:hypothetical protein
LFQETPFHQLNSNNWKPAELQNPINENEPLLRGSLFRSLFAAVNSNVKKGQHLLKYLKQAMYLKKKKVASLNRYIYQELSIIMNLNKPGVRKN